VKPKPKPAATPRPTQSATPSDVVIHLTANQDCWVQLTSSLDGSQIYMGTIPAGSSMTWTEKQAVKVTLGNPGGIVLTVDGKRQTPNTATPVTLNFSPASGSQSS
jgi:hypothetical protein